MKIKKFTSNKKNTSEKLNILQIDYTKQKIRKLK